MHELILHIKRFDWLLMGAVLLLMLFGLITLFSLSTVSTAPFFQKQIIWTAVGIILMISASWIDFRIFKTQGVVVFLLYLAAVILLFILIASKFAIRGVEGWLKFGSVYFQPVELAKISLIILLAKFFSKRHIEIYRIQHVLVSGFYLAVPVMLVLLQPDLGSAIVLIAIWLAITLFSGMRLKHFFYLIVLGIIISIAGWSFGLKPYQKARITTFLNPYADPKGGGYQMIQSMIAVGSGKVWGKGIGYGSQSHLNFLPEAETDFIFAAFAEEWGFAGVVAMLGLFFFVLWRIARIAQKSGDNFSRLYALGFASSIFVQGFIHLAMNMGLMPITGLTLPFVSYGGSSLVMSLIGIGILQNIKINARREVE